MKGLILFLGESFRMSGQGCRIIGGDESYEEQMNAAKTHIKFIKSLNCSINVFLGTYPTKFTNNLADVYKEYLIGGNVYSERIGFHNLLD